MSIHMFEPESDGMGLMIRLDHVILRQQTAYQEVVIADTKAYGRVLFLDSLIQSAEHDEVLYHETLVHPALTLHGNPRRVLIGGTGEGATLREVMRHPSVEEVLTVDLDAEVVEICKQHLPQWHAGAFADPRVHERIEDVHDTLQQSPAENFDAIILDITDPVEEGPSMMLFSQPFFQSVARALTNDGVLVMQAGEFDVVDLAMARSVRSTLQSVFPFVHFLTMVVPSFHALWGFALAAKHPLELYPQDLAQRIQKLGSLDVYTAETHRHMLELPPYLQKRLAVPGSVILGAASEGFRTYGKSS